MASKMVMEFILERMDYKEKATGRMVKE